MKPNPLNKRKKLSMIKILKSKIKLQPLNIKQKVIHDLAEINIENLTILSQTAFERESIYFPQKLLMDGKLHFQQSP